MIKNSEAEKLTVSQAVENILENKPFILDLFKIDAVNYSGLARHLVPEIQKHVGRNEININAVIMAVKRYGDSVGGAELSDSVRKVVSECSIFIKNDLMGLTVRKSKRIYDIVLDLQNTVDYLRGDVLYVLQSASEIEIVTERKTAKELLKRLGPSDILHKENALALIGIKKPERSLEIPGIIYYFSGFLAMNGVSLIDVAILFMEINFVVHEKDAARAYTILDNVVKAERQRQG